MLDWKNGVAKLHYGHVEFRTVDHGGYWLPEVWLDDVQVWADDDADHSVLPTQGSAQRRAEWLYSHQTGGWVAADMLAEILAPLGAKAGFLSDPQVDSRITTETEAVMSRKRGPAWAAERVDNMIAKGLI